MASAIKPISVENDSVIYEHIIPRSVRQKWMRRASVEHLDLILTPPREHLALKKPDKHVGNSIRSDKGVKGIDYGDSIVSHDVQSMKNNGNGVIDSRSESFITPEEEKAVFNAFGVKLRHTGIHSISQNNPPGDLENIEKPFQLALEVNAKHLDKHQNLQKDLNCSEGKENNTIANNRVRDTSKRQRPLSMPVIMDKIEVDHQIQASNFGMSKTKPKAYISPHAKVPWKRNIITKIEESRGNSNSSTKRANGEKNEQEKHRKMTQNVPKSKTGILPNEDGNGMENKYNMLNSQNSRSNKVKLDDQRKEIHNIGLREKPHNGESVVTNESLDMMHSVSERRKTFEKYSRRAHNGVFGNLGKQAVDSAHKGNITEKPNLNKIVHCDNSEMVDRSNSHIRDRHKVERESTREIKYTKAQITQSFDMIPIENSDHWISKHQKEEKEKELHTEDDNEKLLNIFQSIPVYKPDDKVNKMTTLVNEKGNKQSETLSNAKNITEMNKSDAFTMRKRYEKKINKMVILTGEQRDRELRSKFGTFVKKDTSKGSKDEISQKLAFNEEKPKEVRNHADIPVTNLDDTMQSLIQNQGHDIPVTNLDELPPSSLSVAKVETNTSQATPIAKSLVIALPKKPGKYDADRRELVAPKVVFDNPVTGLVSNLSPKGRVGGKKKLRVSFVSDELAMVHTYPSESVAMEMYDEANPQNETEVLDDTQEKSIDDAIENESNSVDFHCYMPNSFSDLPGTLERERHTIARQNEIAAEKEVETESSLLKAFERDNSLFTETSIGETNAILF